MGNYPSHRATWPTEWMAVAGATIDDEPLPPKTAERTRAIRAVFLHHFGGHASIAAVGHRCWDLGLLDDFSTHRSAYEAIMRALRPITTWNYAETERYARSQARGTAPSARSAPPVRSQSARG